MDVSHLYYFKCVAETEHITNAAKKLYVSQAHLSRVIADLEREVGVPLFDRIGRGIALNESGRIFYRSVVEMIGTFNRAKHNAQEAYLSKKFQLAVATNAAAYMPDLLTRLVRQSPNLTVRQYSASRGHIIGMLKNGTADFAIVAPPIDDIELECLELFDETPVVVCSRGHWLEGFNRVPLAEIIHEPFVGVMKGYGARDTMDRVYESSGLIPTFAIETGDSSSVLRFVSNGLGIALCPKSLIIREPYFKDHFIELEEEVPCILGLIWMKGRSFQESDDIFLQETVDYFRDIAARIAEYPSPSGEREEGSANDEPRRSEEPAE